MEPFLAGLRNHSIPTLGMQSVISIVPEEVDSGQVGRACLCMYMQGETCNSGCTASSTNADMHMMYNVRFIQWSSGNSPLFIVLLYTYTLPSSCLYLQVYTFPLPNPKRLPEIPTDVSLCWCWFCCLHVIWCNACYWEHWLCVDYSFCCQGEMLVLPVAHDVTTSKAANTLLSARLLSHAFPWRA